MQIGEPRSEALGYLRGAAEKAKRRGYVPFPPAFVIAPDGLEVVAPLARLIQGGRGGAVRLRLYLCITMMATGKPYDLRKPPGPNGWTRMLALDPKTGPRRVASNLKWLADQQLIDLQPQWGRPAAITLLSADGDGKEYTQPREEGRYVGMPVEFWTQGWLLQLSPTATALLFVLREALGGHSEPQYIPTTRRNRYGLSSDTWTKARKELEAQGLLAVKHEPQGTFYDFTRLRNAYQLNLERLGDSPFWT
ncbi:hypothetical protein ASD97_32935 [Streptomyces sp. Root63]|uniref:hypothetical protein n=1 Tax=unclassified Streptomyces TaxID=2593676 RepID=UPI0006FD1CE5|nr:MULTISPECIES: hypothetical protein [unclassified Streptomyces]KQX33174.1 hypothetical protein ASD29_13040 [Streptomyces sp. Root1295]KRA48458.1 hypothetical protein ASD97_32935 [Streptomyces sp. Root63]